ncbi:anthocyanin 5-aromatic acyltransferase-like [Musa acuminata AAA Group]|uniref:anthocyanin 5-aromatic acyltransferase-like n=1 Tax=Musa acuminata AAA Group TaxID=214697 RepID=UPI0031DA0C4A
MMQLAIPWCSCARFIRRLTLSGPTNVRLGFIVLLAKETTSRCSTDLSQDQIKRLKQLVVAKIEEGKTESFHCSTIVVSYAYVWPCLVPAQGVDRDKTAHLAFAVDCRGRLSLPLPAGYFGICVGSCYVEVGSGDTAGGDDDGFLAACEATGRTIERLKEGLFDGAERWLEKTSYVLANRAMSVAGSPKLISGGGGHRR